MCIPDVVVHVVSSRVSSIAGLPEGAAENEIVSVTVVYEEAPPPQEEPKRMTVAMLRKHYGSSL